MANIKSQIKRNRQNARRSERNKSLRSEIRTRTQAALEAAEAGDEAAAHDAMRLAQKRIDVAVTKNVIHPNTAARRKSRLAKQITALLSG